MAASQKFIQEILQEVPRHSLIFKNDKISYIENSQMIAENEDIITILSKKNEKIIILYVHLDTLPPSKLVEEFLLKLSHENIYFYFNSFNEKLIKDEKSLGCDPEVEKEIDIFLEKQKKFLQENWKQLDNISFLFLVQKIENNLKDINCYIDGWTLLQYKIAKGLPNVEDLLLDCGITGDIEEVIHFALDLNRMDYVEKLSSFHIKNIITKIKNKDDAIQKDELNRPPIFYAILAKDLESFKKILEWKQNEINIKIDNENLLEISSRLGNLEIIKFILKNDYFFHKKYFDFNKANNEDIKNFYNEQIELKKHVELNNLNEIKYSIDKEEFRLLWKFDDEYTLVDIAILYKKVEIYAYFLFCGVLPSSTSIELWGDEEKQKLKNLSKKYWYFDPDRVIKFLDSKTSTYQRYNSIIPAEKYEWVYKNLYGFDNNEEVNNLNRKYLKPILDVLMEVSDLKICYDPEQSSIEILDPFCTKTTFGVCNISTHEFLIGGKILDNNKNDVLGTTIHEFTHLACQIIWGNLANPYGKDEKDIEVKFQKILSEVKAMYNSNEESLDAIIGRVFKNYSGARECQQASELIVRVSQIIAYYGERGLEILNNQVPELLSFYENNFLPICNSYVNPEFRFKRYSLNKFKIYSLFGKEKIPVKNVPIYLSDITISYLHLIPEEKFHLNKCKAPTVVYKKDGTPSFFIDGEEKTKKSIPISIVENLKQFIIDNKSFEKIFISKSNPIIESLLLSFVSKNEEEKNSLLSSNDMLSVFEKNEKILILGKAGMGKSALCKNIIYQFASNELWQQRFKWVFYIPLRNLNEVRYPKTESIYREIDIIFKECLPMNDPILKNLIYEEVDTENILWLLDGYHELQEPVPIHLEKVLKKLLEKKNVIITSRHHESISKLDVNKRLEIKGFKPENIEDYVRSFFYNETDESENLLEFLKDSKKEEVAHAPISLELICNIWKWDKKKITQQNSLTITKLYKDISLWLMHRFLSEKGYKVVDLEDEHRVWRRLFEEVSALEKIAFYLMERNQLVLTHKEFETIVPNIKKDKSLYVDIIDIRLLALMGSPENHNYEFVHQSFQEYFAARYIVKSLQLPLDNIEYKRVVNFIKSQKYTEFNQLLFNFTSGLLDAESKFAKIYWENIHSYPIDVTGIKHICLLLSCLQETDCDVIFSICPNIKEYISNILPEILKFSKNVDDSFPRNSLLFNLKKSGKVISHTDIMESIIVALASTELLYGPTVMSFLLQHEKGKPRDLIFEFLKKKILTSKKIDEVFKYAVVSIKDEPDAVQWLISMAKSNNPINKKIAFYSFAIQKFGNDEVITCLINTARHGIENSSININNELRILAIQALCNIEDYREEVLDALNAIADGNDSDKVKESAKYALQDYNDYLEQVREAQFWHDIPFDDYDDYDDPDLTPSERLLVFSGPNLTEDYNVTKQITVTIKDHTTTVSRERYDEFLIRKLNDKSLNIIRVGMLDNNKLNYLINNKLYLLSTPLTTLIKAYASLQNEPESELLGRLIVMRILCHGITITIVPTGLVIYEEGKIILLKAINNSELFLKNFVEKFSKLIHSVAKEINFPMLDINHFKSIPEILSFPRGSIEDELFVETTQLKELKALVNEKLNPERVSNLNGNQIRLLLRNEQYLLNTPLDNLIEALVSFSNKSEREIMERLIAQRIFYCGAIIIESSERLSIYDGKATFAITYKPLWINFIERFLGLLCKFSYENKLPTISNEIGSNDYSHLNAIYSNFILFNMSLSTSQRGLNWMKELHYSRKAQEQKESCERNLHKSDNALVMYQSNLIPIHSESTYMQKRNKDSNVN